MAGAALAAPDLRGFARFWRALFRILFACVLLGKAHAATYGYAPTTLAWIDNTTHADIVWTGASGGPAPECTGGYAAVDDDISGQINIGFAFPFGGASYSQVRIMSNGRLQFNNNRYCYYGTQSVGPPPTYTLPYPNANLSNTMRIYGADFCPAGGGSGCSGRVTYALLGSAPYRTFVVTWSQMREWNSGTSLFNLQIVLHENGDFVYQYKDIANQSQGVGQVGWQLGTSDYDLVDAATVNSLAYSAVRFYRPTAPIAEYRLDECPGTISISDASGNGLHGTPVGSYGAGTTGTVCRAGAFNGANAYVNVPNNALLNQPRVSVSAWVRHSSATLKNWEAILAKGDSTYRLHLNGGCSINGVTTPQAFTFGFNAGCANADLNSGVVPVPGQWYHVVGTYDGATIKIFVNGVLKNAQALITSIGSNTYPLYIGENSQATGRRWSGDIDEVKIFDRALPDNEVQAMYLNESQGIERNGALRVCVPCATNLGGFNIFESSTPAGAVNGVIKTKIAGTRFSSSSGNLDIVALNAARTGVATAYSASNVRFELLDASGEAGAPDANGCYAGTSVILAPASNQTLTNGRGSISAGLLNVANAYPRVRVRAYAPATSPTRIGCSSDVFAIRPAYFNVSGMLVSDADYQTPGGTRILNNTAASGGVVHMAAKPFSISGLTARNAGNATTTNYQGSPLLVPGNLVQPDPAVCSSCVPGAFNVASWTASSGALATSSASYSEVGSFSWEVEDRMFAAVDVSDSTKSQRYFRSNAVIYTGRFVPANFLLQLNTPLLQTFGSACATRSFTYLGQPFGYALAPVAAVTAQNAAGGTTANFRTSGGLWTLKTPLPAFTSNCAAPTQTCALQRQDTSAKTRLTTTWTYASTGATPGWDGSKTVTGAATLIATGNGTGTLALPNTDRIVFNRPAPAPNPVAPFNATLSLALLLQDFSEAGLAGNPASIDGALAATPVVFDAGNALHFGRLHLNNAYGSELLPLRVEGRAEYWDGSRWVPDAADSCSQFGAGSMTASGGIAANTCFLTNPPPANPNNASCLAQSPATSIVSGKAVWAVFDKTPVQVGFADLLLTVPDWLKGDWTSAGAGYDESPLSRVKFGSPKAPYIYLRERY